VSKTTDHTASSKAGIDGPIGAYGLRVTGLEAARPLLVRAADDWPAFELWNRVDAGPFEELDWVSETHAELRLRTGGRLYIDRRAGRAEFVTARPLGPQELVHPYLAPVAAIVAHWHGRESVHAGALAVDGRVWGVVGDRESGKSSTLARLALDGMDVVSDDLLILEGRRVLAGPRAIDLREEPAARLGVGASIGIAGARERWRVELGQVPEQLELEGWIHLAWGLRVEAVPVEGRERIERLLDQRGARLPSLSPAALLELASLPSWEVRRPQAWETLGEAADCIRELTGD
jgi:hypothetical protein